MEQREIIFTIHAAENIAAISYFIGSKGLVKTADKFVIDFYNFILKLSNQKISYALCRDKKRSEMGLKCISYKKKFTIVILEEIETLTIIEIISSKMIKK